VTPAGEPLRGHFRVGFLTREALEVVGQQLIEGSGSGDQSIVEWGLSVADGHGFSGRIRARQESDPATVPKNPQPKSQLGLG
jgi:hypothetical protein